MKFLLKLTALFTAMMLMVSSASVTAFAEGEDMGGNEVIDDNIVTEDPNPDDLTVPGFTLSVNKAYVLQAGKTSQISIGLRSFGEGRAATVSAMLSSPTSDIIVEDIGERTNTSSVPLFIFKVSVPESTPAGMYSLSLDVKVFDKKGGIGGTYTYAIPVKVESDVNTSALTIKSYETSKETIEPGDSFDLTLTLENGCGIDLENIEVLLSGLDSTKFVLDAGFSKQTVSIEKGSTGNVTFPLVACSGISSVRESIGVQAVYCVNPMKPDITQTLETSVIISCKPEAEKQELGKYDLTMTDYNVSSSDVAENTKFTLSITLKNTSERKIENARLSILGLDGSRFAIDKGLTYVDFDIEAGKTKDFSFDIVGCKGISSIREVIPVLIEYGTVSSEASVTIPCAPSETAGSGDGVFAPNIIIENYDFGGEFVTAGDTFNLSVNIKNTASDAVIENLKVTVNGASNNVDGGIAFSPANSSNSFFFEKIGVKGTENIALDLIAKSDAVPNSYPVEIAFVYEYSVGGKRYQASPVTETITIPLQQEDRLTVNEPEYPNYAVGVGEMCYISTSIVNKGKSGVYNVTVSVEGEGFDISERTYYIGNINSGSEEYYDAQITPNMEGDISGEIIITYEDANGTEKEQRASFNFSAVTFDYGMDMGYMDMPMDEFGGEMMGEMPQEAGFNWVPVVIAAVVVIAVVIIIIVVVKKRKKKRELEEDDEDI